MLNVLVGLAVLCAVVVSHAAAQCVGQSVDGPSAVIPGVNGSVNACVEWDPDGAGPLPLAMVVGGEFSAAGSVTANSAAMWNGVEWQALNGGASGPVYDLAVLNGVLYAARAAAPTGGFVHLYRWTGTAWQEIAGSGGSVRNRLVVFNGEVVMSEPGRVVAFDGSTLRTLNGAPSDAYGYGALVVQDGSLYLARMSIHSVSVWAGSGWQALPTTLSGQVCAMSGSPFGLLVAGSFAFPSQDVRVVRWNGSAWQTVSTASQVGIVPSWMTAVDGAVYCGQNLSTRKWDGAAWTTPWNGNSGELSGVKSIGGRLVSMRAKDDLRGDVVGVAARVGNRWQNFGEGLRNGPWGSGIRAAAARNGELFVSGQIVQDAPTPLTDIAQLHGDRWSAVGDAAIPSESVECMADDGTGLIVGGTFVLPLSESAARKVVRWDGQRWSALGSGLGGTGDGSYVAALCCENGRVYAGGRFTASGGSVVRNVAAWNGAEWAEVGGGLNGPVNALAWFEGRLIAGGEFTGDNSGNAASRVAYWDGAAWRGMGKGLNGQVRFLCVAGGSLYAGGNFTRSGARSVEGVTRWDGDAWAPVGEGLWTTGEHAWVNALGVFGGRLVAAGGYGTPDGRVGSRFLREWNGSAWMSLGAAPDGPVYALIEFGDGLLALGDFQVVDGRVANGCARYERISPPLIVRDTQLVSITPTHVNLCAVRVSARVRVTGRALAGYGGYVGEPGGGEAEYEVTGAFLAERNGVLTCRASVTDACGSVFGELFSVRVVPWCGKVDLGRGGGLEGPDGELNNNDFIAFIGLFLRGDLRADVGGADDGNADSVLDNNDFVWFIDGFFQGCP